MKKWTLTIVTLLLLSIVFSIHTTETGFAKGETIKVTGLIANLREGPGLTYNIVDQLERGDELTVLNVENDWLHVQSGQMTGWVANWLVQVVEGTTAKNQYIVSQVDRLNVRQDPNISSPVLAQLSTGNEANFLKQQGDWIQITYGDTTGWVAAQYVSILESKTTENKKMDTNHYFTIVVNAVNVRKEPSLNSKKLTVVRKDEQYKVVSRQTNWVQIEYEDGEQGWIYMFYGVFSNEKAQNKQSTKKAETPKSITIIYNGTNLREQANTSSSVVKRVDAGEQFAVKDVKGDWFKIAVSKSKTAYVAKWVVSTNEQDVIQEQPKERKKGTLKGLTIVVDAGHGGNDLGTTGARGTDEKNMTLLTAELLKAKLSAAGANVIMTRESDEFIALRKRVFISHQYAADAFISLHYDATNDSTINGFTTYYMHSYQKDLAQYVHAGLAKKIDLRDRGAQPGNYLVLRENRQRAILIELGYLSNPSEERAITTDRYREQATHGIYKGILQYFDDQLNE